jgi:ferredoxin
VSVKANRKELLERTRAELKNIDTVLLEASNLSMAQRVERLLESACDECDDCVDECDECGVLSPWMPTDDMGLSSLCVHSGRNAEVLRYVTTYNPSARIRHGFARAHYNCDDPLDNVPARLDDNYDSTEGTLSVSVTIELFDRVAVAASRRRAAARENVSRHT